MVNEWLNRCPRRLIVGTHTKSAAGNPDHFAGPAILQCPGCAPSLSIRSNVMAGSGRLRNSDEAPKAW